MASENEMTVPEMGPLTAQEMTTDDNLGLQTLLYVIRGLGVDRDRYMTFAEFADFIQKIFTHVYVYGGVGVETSVKPGEIVGFVGGASFTIKPSLISAGSSVWGFSANLNKLNYGNATIEFNVDSNGVSFESGSYKAVVNARSLKLYKNDNVVFELNDGVIDTLKFVKYDGIIERYYNEAVVSMNEIPECISLGDVKGASVKLFLKKNTKVKLYSSNSDYRLIPCDGIYEFVNIGPSSGNPTNFYPTCGLQDFLS